MELSEKGIKPFSKTMQKHLSALESFLKKQAGAFDKSLKKEIQECIRPKGKFIRPMLVFASSWGVNLDDSILERAASVELTHLATLIHDDVIDDASMRRNTPTAYKKYGMRLAILLGDAIFAQAMHLLVANNSTQANIKSIDTIKKLCEGEIKQSISQKNKAITLKDYYEIIKNKTAVLFALSCYLGASCIDIKGWSNSAESAGMELGMAYQIYDDICDWNTSSNDFGKTLGTDLISGKRTLPMIVLESLLSKKGLSVLKTQVEKGDAASIRKSMQEHNVFEICKEKFLERIHNAQKSIKKFDCPASEKLNDFCEAMATLL